MCWKQEWAMAINHMTRAIIHTEKARAKLEKRAARNLETINRVQDKSQEYVHRAEMLKLASARYERMKQGVHRCEEIIAELKAKRCELHRMIVAYGISRRENPARVKQCMGKCDLCKTKLEKENEPCNLEPYCVWNQ